MGESIGPRLIRELPPRTKFIQCPPRIVGGLPVIFESSPKPFVRTDPIRTPGS
jgi:hypothetical protein